MTTAPAPGQPGQRRYWYNAPAAYSPFLRVLAVACVIAILIVGILILADDKVTVDRVASGFIATGVLGAILVFL